MLRLDSGVSALGTGASATTLREIRYYSTACDTGETFTETKFEQGAHVLYGLAV